MLDRYDWRRVETELNATLPMFTRDIAIDGHDSLNVHYVHAKSKVEGAVPLLFVHGCMRRVSSCLLVDMAANRNASPLRARKHLGGDEDLTTTGEPERRRSARLSRCRIESSRIRLFGRAEEAGLRSYQDGRGSSFSCGP